MNEEDIPVKYGGKLEWSWGQHPAIDPAIRDSIKWVNPAKGEDGGNVFPVGPVRWQMTANGEMEAVSLGTVNGVQRRDIIGTIPRPTTSVLQALEPNFGPSTTGTHTHPDEATEYFPTSGATPPESESESQTPGSISANTTQGPPINTGIRNDPTQNARLDSRTVESSASSIPPYDSDNTAPTSSNPSAAAREAPLTAFGMSHAGVPPTVASDTTSKPPASQTNPGDAPSDQIPIRQGTSNTRYEAQSGTHAAGQAKQDTPLVTNHDDKNTVMEPATIGQAAKDTSVSTSVAPAAAEPTETSTAADGQQQQSYLQQAKSAMDSASDTVLGAVGYGGRGQVEKDTAHEEATRIISGGDPDGKGVDENRAAETAKQVDGMKTGDVEDFLRSKYTTANQEGSKSKTEKTVNAAVDGA